MTSRISAMVAATAALVATAPASAQDMAQVSPMMAQRSRELLEILNGRGNPGRTFAPAFRQAVPDVRVREVAAAARAQLGEAVGVAAMTMRDARHADMTIAYQRGTAHAAVMLAPDGRVIGFVIDGLQPADIAAMATLDQVVDGFASLPGATAFVVSDIAAGSEPEVALDAGRPLAIASTIKLVILAELVRAIDAGERKWTDTVAVGTIELPAGGFSGLPPGTRVTLRRLAEEMIHVSDNSATDLLLTTLGRRRVEGMLGPVGFSYADWNVPLLSTLELFKLKGVAGGTLGQRYLALDPLARRRMLDDDLAHTPASAIEPRSDDGDPVLIDGIEWFATPLDLVRAMGWFARRAQTPAGAEALRILALNPGPGRDLTGRFAYLGYKGGSEPGVISMTVLLRDRVARWKVVSATWNHTSAPIDPARFEALFARALTLVGR